MKKIIVLIVTVLCCFALFYFCNNGAMRAKTEKYITVENGMSDAAITKLLKEKGIIKSKAVFKIVNKLSKKGYFKSGTGKFSSKMSYGEIIDILVNKMDSTVKVTIPEGYELCDIVKLLSGKLGTSEDEFYNEIENGKFDYDFISELPPGKMRLEGFVFPDTYYFEKNSKPHDIINACLKRFSQIYTDDMEKQAEKMGYNTLQIITLASIIEKETSSDYEIVSSVFHNRLNSKEFKRLQSCATVIYVTKNPKKRLNAEDIKVDSPYNTYLCDGLPPGPIASPGEKAIYAALNPAKTDYYYFSADGNGKNSFSKTYEEHLAKNRG